MKILFGLFFFCICFSFKSTCQIIPIEDYITCNTTSGTVLGNNHNVSVKRGASLYFNDSSVLLHFDAFGDKTIFFKVFSKKWNQEEKFAVISCFDSSRTANHSDRKELTDSIPDLVITIAYKGNPITDKEYLIPGLGLNVLVTCHFYGKGFDIDFGFPVLFQRNKIPAIRKQFASILSN